MGVNIEVLAICSCFLFVPSGPVQIQFQMYISIIQEIAVVPTQPYDSSLLVNTQLMMGNFVALRWSMVVQSLLRHSNLPGDEFQTGSSSLPRKASLLQNALES